MNDNLKNYRMSSNLPSLNNIINHNKNTNNTQVNNEKVIENKVLNETVSQTFETWEDVDELNMELMRGIYSMGFVTPSDIQKKSIIPVMKGKDILAQAQSGTGKTGAFTVGYLSRIDPTLDKTQILVISPTRELAGQNYDVAVEMSQYMNLRIKMLIGGTSVNDDKRELENNTPHIIVGTPGRIQDMLKRDYLKTDHIKMFVVDEADEMFSKGFKEQLYNILQYMNNDIQLSLFSATMPGEVISLTDKFMRNPTKILVKADELSLKGLRQFFVSLENDQQKFEGLKDIYSSISINQCIIYCNSVKRVKDLTDALRQDNFPAVCMHSGMTDEERREVFNQFKQGSHRLLVASDLIARGINIQQISLVINFDITKDVNTYLHRIGRSARWGRKGVAINFFTKRDIAMKNEIEKHYSIEIENLPANFSEIIQKFS